LPESPSSASSSSKSSGVVKEESALRVPEDASAHALATAARPRARRRGTPKCRLRAIFPAAVQLAEVVEDVQDHLLFALGEGERLVDDLARVPIG
jgi:hypothetical protein